MLGPVSQFNSCESIMPSDGRIGRYQCNHLSRLGGRSGLRTIRYDGRDWEWQCPITLQKATESRDKWPKFYAGTYMSIARGKLGCDGRGGRCKYLFIGRIRYVVYDNSGTISNEQQII